MLINLQVRKNEVLVRSYDGDYIDSDFCPGVFVKSYEETTYTDIKETTYLRPVSSLSILDFKEILRGSNLFGTTDVLKQYAAVHWKENLNVDYSKYKIFNIDIEVDPISGGFPTPEEANDPINAITVIFKGNIFTWGLEPTKKDTYKPTKPNEYYYGFSTEVGLLENFLEFWTQKNPHIITGWNIEGFDIPYIYNRISKILGSKESNKLSVWNWVTTREHKDEFHNLKTKIDIKGVFIMDYLLLYKKYELAPRENYKLDTIAEVELGRKKIDYSEHGSLLELYRKDYKKFIEYNIEDTKLVEDLEAKKKLLELAIFLSAYGRINMDRIFKTIPIWDSIVFHYLHENGKYLEIKNDHNSKSQKFLGAFVLDVVPGFYEYVCSFDLASLYPSIIRQWNLGPDTFVEPQELPDEAQRLYGRMLIEECLDGNLDTKFLKDNNLTMTANGYFYDTTKKSFLSQLMENLFMRRKEEKAQLKKYKTMLSAVNEELERRK